MNRYSFIGAAIVVVVLPLSFAMARHASNMVPDLETISIAENAYFNTHGKYFQVLTDNKLPSHLPGVLADYVNPRAVPLNTAIDTYHGPMGQGYAVRWTIPATAREEGSINSVGYGPEAEARTFTEVLPVFTGVGSTTPQGRDRMPATGRTERAPR